MPIYIKEYLSETGHLSALETGAYLLLMIEYWQSGELPTDDAALASMARLDKQDWGSCRDVILDLFERPSRWDGLTSAQHALGIGRKELRPSIPKGIRVAVFEACEGRCRYCQTDSGPFDIDHVVPYSRGGSHEFSNFTLSCAPCNRSKGARTPEEWRGVTGQ